MHVLPRFEERLAPHQDRLFGYAVAISRDRETARDLLHDCIARAMTAKDTPAGEPAFRAWLFTIMRNLWVDQVRAARRRLSFTETLAETPAMPLALEGVVVEAFAVRQAFGLLSPDHREILALVDISGFSYEEVAGILAVPRGTVMSRVSRARQALARLLSDDGAPQVSPTGHRKSHDR